MKSRVATKTKPRNDFYLPKCYTVTAPHHHYRRKSSFHSHSKSLDFKSSYSVLSSSHPTLSEALPLSPTIRSLTYQSNKSMDHTTIGFVEENSSSHRHHDHQTFLRFINPPSTTSSYDLIKSSSLMDHHYNNRNSYPNLFSIKQSGRLDLSFTKCRFPNDYLPYAATNQTSSNHQNKKRSNSLDVVGFDHHQNYHYYKQHEHYNQQQHRTTSSDSAFDEQTATESTTIHPLDDSLDKSSFLHTKQQQQSNFSSCKLNNSPSSGILNPPLESSSSTSSKSSMFDEQQAHQHRHHKRQHFMSTYPFYPQFQSFASSRSSCCHDSETTKRPYGLIKSCGCCLLIVLAVLILLSLSIVLGFSLYLAIVTNLLTETTFAYSLSGNFKILSGDTFTIRLLNQTSMEFRRKAGRYEKIIHNILHSSLVADSVLYSEIYTFRQGSLIVFFRFYVSKPTFDHLLAIKKSKTIINFGTIENVYLDDDVILTRVREIFRDAFRREWPYLIFYSPNKTSITTANIEIDLDSVKISSLERLTELQYRERLKHRHNYRENKGEEEQVNSIHTSYMNDDLTSERWNKKNFTLSSSSIMKSEISTTTTTNLTTLAPMNFQQQNLSSNHQTKLFSKTPIPTTTVTTTIQVTSINNVTLTATSTLANNRQTYHHYNHNEINNLDLNISNDDNISGPNATITNQIHQKKENQTSLLVVFGIQKEDNSNRFYTTTTTYNSGNLLFGNASFHDLENLVWNDLNNNQTIIDGQINHLDQPPIESREEQEDMSEMIAPEINQTSFQTTTLQPLLAQDVNPTPEAESIDGFLVNNPGQSSTNNESLTIANLNIPTTTKKVLIISEDSFDLYSLKDSNSTTLLNAEDYDDDGDDIDDLEDEFKSNVGVNKPNNLSTTITATMVTTSDNINQTKYNNQNKLQPPLSIIENEFTQPEVTAMTTKKPFQQVGTNTAIAPPLVLAYGTRISKKIFNFSTLSNKYHHDLSSSHNHHEKNLHDINSYNYNSIHKVQRPSTTTTTTTVPAPTIVCKFNEFLCNDSLKCVPFDLICNRIMDCLDGSDELQCLCADYFLRDETHKHKLCDGTIDCDDLSDETVNCPQCREGMFVCVGPTNQCIEMSKVCDGENDCDNGDDEQNCIALIDEDEDDSSKSANKSLPSQNLLAQNYNPKGLLYIQHHGTWAPLCFDSYDLDSENWIDHRYENDSDSGHLENGTSISISSMIQINDMGQAVCKANYFAHLEKIDIFITTSMKRKEFFSISSKLSSMLKPTLSLWSNLFEKVPCKERKVALIECSTIECGMRSLSSRFQRRIIGGQSSSFGSWPWQVALYREGEFQCGAVLIDSQWLLTAAHCFYSSSGAYWTARSGVLRRGSLHRTYHEEVRKIEHVFIHPEYIDKGFFNDIAMLRLDRPLKYSKYIRPICLPDEDDSHMSEWNNQLCTTVGWGKLYEHGRIFPDTLQEVKLPIISTEECRKRTLFLPLYKITDNMFCAGFEHGGRDACLGDSGGPMMCQKENGKWILLGITSNGDGCGRAGRPGVYTKVYNYLTWIQSIIIQGKSDHKMESDKSVSKAEKQVYQNRTCNGHRCPLGKCLKPEQICNHIIDCEEDSSDERNCPSGII